MKVGSLFSGIGGFDLGLERAGFEISWQVEIDPFCNKVLAKHWPNVKRYGDIKNVTNLEPVDLICGGFPCQPFSCAGKRKGKDDDRFLWPEMLRVVSESKPRWIIGENVAGFIDMGLDDCISDLENQGYEVQAFIIPACAVNAPHRRDRVWIVAHAGLLGQEKHEQQTTGIEQSDRHATDAESQQAHTAEPRGLHAEFSGTDSDATDTSNQRLQGSEWPGSYEQGQAAHGSIAECNHAWDEPWIEAATRLCSLDVRLPGGLARPKGWRVNALKAVGNSVVPQIVEIIGRAIMEIEAKP